MTGVGEVELISSGLIRHVAVNYEIVNGLDFFKKIST